MIHETGQIADVSDAGVWVDCSSRNDCQRCAEGRGCGGAIMGRLLGNRQHRVKVTCEHQSPTVGQQVSLQLDEAVLLRAAGLAYLLPLAGLLLGALIGHLMAGESSALLGAGGGLILAWLLARFTARWYFSELQPLARPR